MLKNVLPFILLMLFTSCAKKASTPASFKLVMGATALSAANAPGGLALYGHNTTSNERFGRVFAPPYSDVSLELNNGSWNFVAIAWDGQQPMTGIPKCAVNQGFTVAGIDTSVNLNLTNANCASNPSVFAQPPAGQLMNEYFASEGIDTVFAAMKFFACGSLHDITSPAAANCNQNSIQAAKDDLVSFRVSLVSFGADSAQAALLTSQCYNPSSVTGEGYTAGQAWLMAQTPNSPTPNTLRVPWGGVNSPFRTRIDFYSGTDCNPANSPLLKSSVYPNGLLGPTPDTDVLTLPAAGIIYAHFAVNFSGSGYSPFWAKKPVHKCFSGIASEIDCVPQLNTNMQDIDYEADTGSSYTFIVDATDATDCNVSGPSAGSFNGTPTASFSSVEENGVLKEKCHVTVYPSNIPSTDTSNGTIGEFTINFTGGPTSITKKVFVRGQNSHHQEAHQLKLAAFEIAGYMEKPQHNVWDEVRFGSNASSSSDYNGLMSEVLREIGPEAFGGLLYKSGVKNCSDIVNSINQNFSQTVEIDPGIFATVTARIKAGQIAKPSFMLGSGNFQTRIEFEFNGVPETIMEFDCNVADRAQWYIEMIYDEDEIHKKKIFVTAASEESVALSGANRSDTISAGVRRGDVEAEVVMVEKKDSLPDNFWDRNKIMKYHHTANDNKTKVWMAKSEKSIWYNNMIPAYDHRWMLSRGSAIIDIETKLMEFLYDEMDDYESTTNTPVNAEDFLLSTKPDMVSCSATALGANIFLTSPTDFDFTGSLSTLTGALDSDKCPNIKDEIEFDNSDISTAINSKLTSMYSYLGVAQVTDIILGSSSAQWQNSQCELNISLNFPAEAPPFQVFGPGQCKSFGQNYFGELFNNSSVNSLGSDRIASTDGFFDGSSQIKVPTKFFNLGSLKDSTGTPALYNIVNTETTAIKDGGNDPIPFNMVYVSDPDFDSDQFGN